MQIKQTTYTLPAVNMTLTMDELDGIVKALQGLPGGYLGTDKPLTKFLKMITELPEA